MYTCGLAYLFKSKMWYQIQVSIFQKSLKLNSLKECILLLSYMVLKKKTTAHLNTREAILCSHQDLLLLKLLPNSFVFKQRQYFFMFSYNINICYPKKNFTVQILLTVLLGGRGVRWGLYMKLEALLFVLFSLCLL